MLSIIRLNKVERNGDESRYFVIMPIIMLTVIHSINTPKNINDNRRSNSDVESGLGMDKNDMRSCG